MKSRGLFFKPINLTDVVIWFFIITGQVFNFIVAFSGESFLEKQQFLLTHSFILSMVTLIFLHRWIANAWNWWFLLFVGVFQITVFIVHKPFALIDWNDWILVTYLPFVVVLQCFRILKIKRFGDELAIPLSHSTSVFGDSVKWLDIVCYLVSMFLLIGVPLLIGWFFKR